MSFNEFEKHSIHIPLTTNLTPAITPEVTSLTPLQHEHVLPTKLLTMPNREEAQAIFANVLMRKTKNSNITQLEQMAEILMSTLLESHNIICENAGELNQKATAQTKIITTLLNQTYNNPMSVSKTDSTSKNLTLNRKEIINYTPEDRGNI